MKKYIEIEDLCKGLPREIVDYMNNAKSLKFEEEPNYKYLKNLFNIILKKRKFNFDNNYFSWIEKKDNSNDNDHNHNLGKSNSVGKPTNIKMIRKSSPQNRLYNQIKKSIENKNNIINITSKYKQNQKNEKIGHTSPNIENRYIKLSQKTNEAKFNKSKIILNNVIKNEANSESSNTMKVMYNNNINSVRNESNGNFPRVSSENNIYHDDNLFTFKMNEEQKKQFEKNYSPENIRFNNKFYLNQYPISEMKNSDDDNSKNLYFNNKNIIYNNNNENYELKKIHFLKNENINKTTNNNGKIIKISPLKNNPKYTNINNNNNNNRNKINQIEVFNSNFNIKNINNNSLNNNKNSFNFNTYNSVNSFNDTLDKTRTNNNNNTNTNNIHNDYYETNMQNYKRINHIIYQKNKMKINTNNNNYFNLNNNNSFHINKCSFVGNNNSNKIIHLDKVEKPNREINSVNIRKKPLNDNLSLKKKQNIIINHFNNRPNNSSTSNKIKNIYPKSILGKDGNLNKNKNIIITKNISNNLNNNKINIPNIKARPSNSYNNINRNNNIIRQIKKNNLLKNISSNDNSVNLKKENNIIINNIKNQNNLKRIIISNNSKNLHKNVENNNNYIRLDKMKDNMNILANINSNNSKRNNSSNKKFNEIMPNYNNYKINSLKRIPNNNNRFFIKKAFPSIRYKTENDSNSILIHKNNNNLTSTNNNIMNSNNSINISRNKIKLNYDNNSKNNNFYNYHNYSERQKIGESPLFIEIEPKIINNFSLKTKAISSNNINESLPFNKKIQNDNNYLNNRYKTEDIEIIYSDNNKDDLNKSNRINKYKMIRYKGN